MAALFCAKGSLKTSETQKAFSGCLWLIFRPRRRFAAYHEQGQAPAPRRSIPHRSIVSGCPNPAPIPHYPSPQKFPYNSGSLKIIV